MSYGRKVMVRLLKGQDEKIIPDEGSLELLENVEWDAVGGWRTAPGSRPALQVPGLSDPMRTVQSVDTIASFTQHGGAIRWLVWEEEGETAIVHGSPRTPYELKYFDAGARAPVSLMARTRPGPLSPKTQYLAVRDWLYMVNGGSDMPVRWNGKWLAPIGHQRVPAAPEVMGPEEGFDRFDGDWQGDPSDAMWTWGVPGPLGVGTEISNVDLTHASGSGTKTKYWRKGYAVTYVNELGQESPPSATVYITGKSHADQAVGDPARRLVRVSIPNPPPGVYAIRLWATLSIEVGKDLSDPGVAGALYLCEEFQQGVGLIYIDGKPDEELGSALDVSRLGLFPTNAQYIMMHKSTLFVAGHQPGVIQYSDGAFHEQFPPLNRFMLSSGEQTGMVETVYGLYVFSVDTIHRIVGDGSSGWKVETVSRNQGNVAPNALQSIPGVGIFFVDKGGPKLLVERAPTFSGEEQPPQVISLVDAVSRTWRRRVDISRLATARSSPPMDGKIWLQVPADGASDGSLTLGFVYNYIQGYASTRTGFDVNCFARWGDHLVFGGSQEGTGIQVVTRGASQINGQDFTSKIRTPWLDFGDPHEPNSILSLELHNVLNGAPITMRQRQDGDVAWDLEEETHDQYETMRRVPDVWGASKWDASAYWGDYPAAGISIPIDPKGGYTSQVEVEASRLHVVGFMMRIREPVELPKRTK